MTTRRKVLVDPNPNPETASLRQPPAPIDLRAACWAFAAALFLLERLLSRWPAHTRGDPPATPGTPATPAAPAAAPEAPANTMAPAAPANSMAPAAPANSMAPAAPATK